MLKRLVCLILAALVIGCFQQHTETEELFAEAHKHVLNGDVDWVVQAVQTNPTLKSQRDSWDQTSLLHTACINGQKQSMVEALLKLGFDPNAQNDLGQTPLHIAMKFGADKVIVDALIQAGADPKLSDKNGEKPSDYPDTIR